MTVNSTNGGFKLKDEKDWHAKPYGPSGPEVVTTVTPVANSLSARRTDISSRVARAEGVACASEYSM